MDSYTPHGDDVDRSSRRRARIATRDDGGARIATDARATTTTTTPSIGAPTARDGDDGTRDDDDDDGRVATRTRATTTADDARGEGRGRAGERRA